LKLVNDLRIRAAGILVIATLRLGLMIVAIYTGEVKTWEIFENTLLAGFLIWESSRAVVLYFHRRYPLGQSNARRYWQEASVLVAVDSSFYLVRSVVFMGVFSQEGPPKLIFHLFGLLYTLLYGMLAAAFYELLIYMEAWKKANQEAEQLKKANLVSQLDSLKNQVKPHFLFNSLNTLTALVEKQPAQAVQFIAELSKVYRYLLQSNQKELIALSGELDFTRAYFFLLQMRFGEGICLQVDVEKEYLDHLVPPLTLQMLVENAVKHNQVSVRKPLSVRIAIEQGKWLVVSNNAQPKRTSVPSSGMGLANIATKYKLLNQPQLRVQAVPTHFTVKVPLIDSLPV
jgi:sensor histidine kinase YesM